MQIELYFHGNPKGFDYKGPNKEKDSFFQRFYNRKKVVSKELVVEKRDTFYYYTLLLSKNVIDSNGRPDSYFGITIRFDVYYKIATNIYSLLDTICSKWIIGEVLKESDDNLQYTAPQLNITTIDGLQNDLVTWIQRANEQDFVTIKNQSGSNGQIEQLNLADCSPDNVREAIQKYGSVSISIEYSLLREKEQEATLQKFNQQWTSKCSDLQDKYDAAVKNSQSLNETICSLQNQLEKAQSDLKKEKKDFEDYKSKNEVSSTILSELKKEKEALLKIAKYVDSLNVKLPNEYSSAERNNKEKKRSQQKNKKTFSGEIIKKYLPLGVGILILGFVIWLAISIKSCSDNSDNEHNPNNQSAVMKDEKVLVAQQETKVTQPLREETSEGILPPSIDINNLRIDVMEFTKSKTYMTLNDAYSIRVLDKQQNSVDGIKGLWKVKNSDFHISNPNTVETTVYPARRGDDLEILFYVDGCETPVKRIIEVRDN